MQLEGVLVWVLLLLGKAKQEWLASVVSEPQSPLAPALLLHVLRNRPCLTPIWGGAFVSNSWKERLRPSDLEPLGPSHDQQDAASRRDAYSVSSLPCSIEQDQRAKYLHEPGPPAVAL